MREEWDNVKGTAVEGFILKITVLLLLIFIWIRGQLLLFLSITGEKKVTTCHRVVLVSRLGKLIFFFMGF